MDNEIKLPEFLEHWHISEWRKDKTSGDWIPWGSTGMCNGTIEQKSDGITPPSSTHIPRRAADVWVWDDSYKEHLKARQRLIVQHYEVLDTLEEDSPEWRAQVVRYWVEVERLDAEFGYTIERGYCSTPSVSQNTKGEQDD